MPKSNVSAVQHKKLGPKLLADYERELELFCFSMFVNTGLGQPQDKTTFGRHIKGSAEENAAEIINPSPYTGETKEQLEERKEYGHKAITLYNHLRRLDDSSASTEDEKLLFDATDEISHQNGSSKFNKSSDTLNDKRRQCLKINREIDAIMAETLHKSNGLYQERNKKLDEVRKKENAEKAVIIDYYNNKINAKPEPSETDKTSLEETKKQKIADVNQRLKEVEEEIEKECQQGLESLAAEQNKKLDAQFDALLTLKKETDPETDKYFEQNLNRKRFDGHTITNNTCFGITLELNKIPKDYFVERIGTNTLIIRKPAKVGYNKKEFIRVEKDGDSYKIHGSIETAEEAILFAEMIIVNFKDKSVTISLPENYPHKKIIIDKLKAAGFSEKDIVIKTKNDKGITIKEETVISEKISPTDTDRVKENKMEKAENSAKKTNGDLSAGKASALRDDEKSAAETSPIIAPVKKSLKSKGDDSNINRAKATMNLNDIRNKHPERYKEEIALIATMPVAACEIQTQENIDDKSKLDISSYVNATVPAGNFDLNFGNPTPPTNLVSFTAYLDGIKTNTPPTSDSDILGIINTLTTFRTDIENKRHKESTVYTVLTKTIEKLNEIKKNKDSLETKRKFIVIELSNLNAAINATTQSAAINKDITDEIKKSPQNRSRAITSYTEICDDLNKSKKEFETAAGPTQQQQAIIDYFKLVNDCLEDSVSGDYAPPQAPVTQSSLSSRAKINSQRNIIPGGGRSTTYLTYFTPPPPVSPNDKDFDIIIQILTQPTSVTHLNHLNPAVFANNPTATIESCLSEHVRNKLKSAADDLKAALDSEYALQNKKPSASPAELLEAAKKTEAAKEEFGLAVKMAKQDVIRKQRDLENLNLRKNTLEALKIDTTNPNAKEIADLLIAANSAPPKKDQKTINYISSLFDRFSTPLGALSNNDPLRREVTNELQKTERGKEVLAKNIELTKNLRTYEETMLRAYLDNFRKVLRARVPSNIDSTKYPTIIDYLYQNNTKEEKEKAKSRLLELDKMLDQQILKKENIDNIIRIYQPNISTNGGVFNHYYWNGTPEGSTYSLTNDGVTAILEGIHTVVTPKDLKAAIDDKAGGGVPTPSPLSRLGVV